MEKLELLCTLGGNAEWYKILQNVYVPKKTKNRTAIKSSSSTSAYLSKGTEIRILKRYLHPHAHCSIILKSQNMETSTGEQLKRTWCSHAAGYDSAFKEGNPAIGDNVAGPGGCDAE